MKPATPQDSARSAAARWLLRPSVALPIVFGLVVLVAIAVPQVEQMRAGDSRLTTHSPAPMGGKLFYELTQRLGWKPERRDARDAPPGADVIHAILGAEVPLHRRDVALVLERVREGAGLLVVARGGAYTFLDSLNMYYGLSAYAPAADTLTNPCPPRPRGTLLLWFGRTAFLSTVRWRGAPPDSVVNFIEVTPDPPENDSLRVMTPVPALAGFPYGRGRIVVATDADIFRNDALRGCTFGLDVAAVRALEYLSAGGERPRERIVFDEFHHGYGMQPGAFGTITSYLGGTSSGRAFTQLCIAGLVLMAALAPRTIPPRHFSRIERRSPFEHVDALSRAYAQVGATRTATGRLLRGLRRRVEPRAFRAARDAQDAAFLDRIADAAPALADDVALLRRALSAGVPAREFARVGDALHRIEDSLTRL